MSTPQPSKASSPESLAPLVFVVDDEPMIGTIVELTLSMAQYRTKVFKDPTTALEAFRRTNPKPPLLFTDYNMPGLTGLELMRACLEAHPGLKTILCSGTVDEGFLRQLTPQPDIFIPKPFFPQDLLTAVGKLLGK